MAAMLVYQNNPVWVELISYVNTFFCSNKLVSLLAMSECSKQNLPLNFCRMLLKIKKKPKLLGVQICDTNSLTSKTNKKEKKYVG